MILMRRNDFTKSYMYMSYAHTDVIF